MLTPNLMYAETFPGQSIEIRPFLFTVPRFPLGRLPHRPWANPPAPGAGPRRMIQLLPWNAAILPPAGAAPAALAGGQMARLYSPPPGKQPYGQPLRAVWGRLCRIRGPPQREDARKRQGSEFGLLIRKLALLE